MKIKKKNLHIYNASYKPLLSFLNRRGKFPYNLTLGFETEFTPDRRYWGNWLHDGEIPFNKIPNFLSKCFYFKEDESCGMEMNSFPFNYNWFIHNRKLLEKSIKFLKGRGSVNRRCGFHIHVSKKFFNKLHAIRFRNFFYENKRFFEELSLRKNTIGLNTYASLDPYLRTGKYTAVNRTHRNTLEVRIFQGTLNWKVISSYLEMVCSIVMYTKCDSLPTIEKYKSFLKSIKIYNNAQWLVNNYKKIQTDKTWSK